MSIGAKAVLSMAVLAILLWIFVGNFIEQHWNSSERSTFLEVSAGMALIGYITYLAWLWSE